VQQASVSPTFDRAKMKQILTRTMRFANKAIGHITDSRGRDLALSDVESTCGQVLHLVNYHLYKALDHAPVKYSEL
jgi:hypothetical protein